MKEEFPKVYNPKLFEEKIYQFWEEKKLFNPDFLPKNYKKPFVIFLPPPNITGTLHMGHALNSILQDILIRYKRLQHFRTLFLPGIDHAGIATQRVVEKELLKEGKTRFELGKEEFLKRVWKWKEKYGNLILDQFKKLGIACDWSRTTFTLDEKYSLAVKKAFLYFFRKGMIYKGERVINYCSLCQTSLSDLELEYEQEKGKLYYIRYLLKDEVGYVTVATTRPETMFGDTALAVNPKDERYKNVVGKFAILPIIQREIPIIADELVDPKFGTGMVKVTPAHDLRDYQIGQKHNLKLIKVIGEDGKITKEAPLKYQGLTILEARKKILKDLEEGGFLEKSEDFLHSVPVCYRCQTKIEFLPSKQWFLSMEKLKNLAIHAVKKGKIKFVPKNFEKIYFNWLENVRDWCISRQIWWGHKIPLEGEEDVLDTWFSSALWPLGTLGWPKKTKDFKKFYPSDVLVTARDIINLWVARMIFFSLELVKKIPFKIVLIHPTVLTKEGKRMSKSKGIGVDPLELIEKYGADATRFGLIWQMKGRQDIRFSEEHLRMAQKFCNKIWNATRYIFLKYKDKNISEIKRIEKKNLKSQDRKILKDLKKLKKEVKKLLDNFEFGKAEEKIYHFFWHKFCDIYLEKTKKRKDDVVLPVLISILKEILILLHPFIPFITEAIYQKLPIAKKPSIMFESI